MAKIHINNPKQVINGGAKKYYFKVKGLGGPKGDKGDTGATGPQGPQGPQGNAATVSVGSTTTLPVGQDATVQNVGTLYNAVLNFGIPQGPRGPQGATGAKGDKGDKGDQGNPGPQGEKGTNATVYVGTTTTTNPGTQARVYNSGTDSNAVLNFEIPRGDVGPMPTIAQTTGQSTTEVMSQKATTDALNNGLATKQNTLTAGNNITISGNTISAKDTTYTAGNNVQINGTTISATDTTYTNGNGLNLNGTEFSADTDVLATKEDLEGYYTKPETDNLLAPKLEAEVVTELPTTGAEGKLYLTPKAHTTSTATGNPIEATVTEQAGQLESFQLNGDTFQQTYTGKNLFNSAVYVSVLGYNAQRTLGVDGSITWVNTTSDSYFPYIYSNSMFGNSQIRSATIPVQPSTQYTVSLKKTTATAAGLYVYEGDSDYVGIKNTYTEIRGDTSYTFTTSETTRYVILRFAKWASQETDVLSEIQLEAGSTATSYEPFVGGQPSPNPEYPQAIQTVTGEQTVTINSTAYPISLGSLELCKLDTYQDYIWKDGEDWKVHKATGKTILTDSTSFTRQTYGTNVYVTNGKFDDMRRAASETVMLASSFGTVSWNDRVTATSAVIYQNLATPNEIYLEIRNTSFATLQDLTTYLGNSPVSVYYELATPTDTVITDQTLIAQLETIRTASLQNGTNTITNSATGTNLAGDMEIGYYGFNPTNRYDKFIWLDLNNNYEQIGSE